MLSTVLGKGVAQDPEVGGASVEVELEGLAADCHGAEVFSITLDGRGSDASGGDGLHGTDDRGSRLASTIFGKGLGVGSHTIGLVAGVGTLVDDEAIVSCLEVLGWSSSNGSCEDRNHSGGVVNHVD